MRTQRLQRRYYTDQAYYKVELDPEIDNPDQRITEDVTAFTKVGKVWRRWARAVAASSSLSRPHDDGVAVVLSLSLALARAPSRSQRSVSRARKTLSRRRSLAASRSPPLTR